MTQYCKNENVDRENKKLNRNVYNAFRSLLLIACIQIKNFQKSKPTLFREFNFLKKDIYGNRTLGIFDIFY